MTDATGEVTYSARYTPWGDTLEASGTGNLTFGYFGGLMDAATGLLYVGDGQYYDPSTGRFLTRNAKPNQTNPYLPFDPTGAMLGPLGVLALVLGSKKKKSKYDVLLFMLVFAVASGMTLTACIQPAPTPSPTPGEPTQPPTVPPGTPTPTPTPSPSPSPTAPPAPTSTPELTCPDLPLSEAGDAALIALIESEFGIIIGGAIGGKGSENWPSVQIQKIYIALSRINTMLGGNLRTSWLGGHLVTFYKYKNQLCDECYYGISHGVTKINFYLVNLFPYHLIYHEMGHILNNAQGGRYTNSLETITVKTDSGERVMGGTNDPYNRIDGKGYIHTRITEPCCEVNAELHPAREDGNNSGEEWGDLFANYVSQNFNLSDPVGKAKYDWVRRQLFGG